MPYRTRRGQIWLVVLSIGTVLSLFGAVLGIIRYGELEEQRNEDRLEYDKGSCERGNGFREDVKKIAMAGSQLDKNIINELTESRPEVQARINERLASAYAEYEALVDEIKLNDCAKLLEPTRALGWFHDHRMPSHVALATD